MIINAPAGATAAEFGGGITSAGTGTNTTDITSNTNDHITNNINVNATSGDADVSQNTKAGNARSGDADAAVNLLNVEDSNLSLSGWFGILFINVFGNWNGNFGFYNPATVGGSGAGPIPAAVTSSGQPPVFRFVPRNGNTSGGVGGGVGLVAASDPGTVLAAHIQPNHLIVSSTVHHNSRWPNVIIGSAVVLFIIADAYNSNRQARRAKPTT
jgi:hypothetical protein